MPQLSKTMGKIMIQIIQYHKYLKIINNILQPINKIIQETSKVCEHFSCT